MIHDLKTWPKEYEAVITGRKRFEFRLNDRRFKTNDRLKLWEWDPTLEKYTGRYCLVRVTYILKEGFGLPEGYCIMSINTTA